MIARRQRPLLALAAACAVLVATALWFRPPWPVDETRYLSVAWEMWVRGDFLVPYLHGEPYSHKPPLLFWLMQAGWWALGVNEWWPRLVAPLFALASLMLTMRLARRLWPARDDIAAAAAWLLFGTLLWTVFTTLTMFDMLVACATLLGMLGTVSAAQGERARGFVTLGIAIGLGVLAKGPVILLHTLPAALLAPWWMTSPRPSATRWYGGVLLAVALGAVIALAWAVPASRAGGAEYGNAIFWGQTAGRMAQSFAHCYPWWWYLAWLPLKLLPWLAWPPLWRALWRARGTHSDPGRRLMLAWMLPVFVAFTFISGKQPQYLLPLVPAFALLAAHALYCTPDQARFYDMLPPAAGLAALGAWWLYAATVGEAAAVARWGAPLALWPALALLVIAAALLALRRADLARRVHALALATAALIALAYAGLIPLVAPANDLRALARELARLESLGHPLAYAGKYHGQFEFLGRLARPVTALDDGTVRDWLVRHPNGLVVVPGPRASSGVASSAPVYAHPHRNGVLYVLDKQGMREWSGDIHARARTQAPPAGSAESGSRVQRLDEFECQR
jgi:4-amino-4-deoxy-L-arabinose transferase-like glycosyltransferase